MVHTQHPFGHVAAECAGALFLAVTLLDAFQTIILPRRPAGRLRITRLFYIATWRPYRAIAKHIRTPRVREQALSIFGPLSLLVLMVCWALMLLAAYGLIYWGAGTPFHDSTVGNVSMWQRLRSCLYVSGTTLFTLGLGDVTPVTPLARVLLVLEAGTGLGFVALVIGYVPVLYNTFSHREVLVALLDSRAGSPPTACELLERHSFPGGDVELRQLLAEWERWAAEILESHVSYTILCFYRSQHDNQSWLAALVAMLDACALLISSVDGVAQRSAQLMFAMGRHTLVDLGHVLRTDAAAKSYAAQAAANALALSNGQPIDDTGSTNRLPPAEYLRVREALSSHGVRLCGAADAEARLAALRALYEPQAQALGDFLLQDLPHWRPVPRAGGKTDSWAAVHNLRSPAAALRGVTMHVSSEAAAAGLHDEAVHPL